MARAKHTVRAEARRRYRQAGSLPGDDTEMALDDTTAKPAAPASRPATQARPTQSPPVRPGFLSAFRGAYHAAHLREDLRYLPKLLLGRGFLAAVGLVLVGLVVALLFPNYTGSAFAWELLVYPGQALAPQLVAGFFAPRASYLLGLVVGIVQGAVFTLFILGGTTAVPSDKLLALLTVSFVTGPISGTLFAAAAAWYRRFLSLSSPKRMAAGARGSAGRPTAKAAPSKRGGGR